MSVRCPSLSRGVAARAAPLTTTASQRARANARAPRTLVVPCAEDPRAEQMAAMEAAMKDPAVQERMAAMQQAMQEPAVQNQMAQMQALMSSPAYLQRMAELREDPELKPMFEEIKAGGMAAMMKAMNDPVFLEKIGEKMGDLEEMMAQGATVPAAAAAAQAEPPIVNNILDAAKYGDVEAVEDYMAIGKGDMKDENGRGALHYAVAYDQGAAAKALLDNGIDVNAVDSEGNTALMFAAGYGRGGAIKALVAAGADAGAKNGEGKTAAELVRQEPRNPLNNDAEIMALLG